MFIFLSFNKTYVSFRNAQILSLPMISRDWLKELDKQKQNYILISFFIISIILNGLTHIDYTYNMA
jgi:hypothetical protein